MFFLKDIRILVLAQQTLNSKVQVAKSDCSKVLSPLINGTWLERIRMREADIQKLLGPDFPLVFTQKNKKEK